MKMKCVLLCAGYGTRLYPLTKNTPKPLLEVAGKPIIEHILSKVEKIGEIDKIFIITNAKFYSNFLDWSKKYNSKKTIAIINDKTASNETRLGAIGDIYLAIKEKTIKEDLLVIGGDNLFEFSLINLNNFFKEKNCSVVALYDVKDISLAKKYGIVELGKNNRIIGFEEKPCNPKSTLASTACYIFSSGGIKEFEKYIEETKKADNLGDFIKYLSNKADVYGFIFSEKWFDIGSHEQLNEVNKYFTK